MPNEYWNPSLYRGWLNCTHEHCFLFLFPYCWFLELWLSRLDFFDQTVVVMRVANLSRDTSPIRRTWLYRHPRYTATPLYRQPRYTATPTIPPPRYTAICVIYINQYFIGYILTIERGRWGQNIWASRSRTSVFTCYGNVCDSESPEKRLTVSANPGKFFYDAAYTNPVTFPHPYCFLFLISVTMLQAVGSKAPSLVGPSSSDHVPMETSEFYPEPVSRKDITIEEMLNAILAKNQPTTSRPSPDRDPPEWSDGRSRYNTEFWDDMKANMDWLKSLPTVPAFEPYTVPSLDGLNDKPPKADIRPQNFDFWWAFIAGAVMFFLATLFGACYRSRQRMINQNLSRVDRLRISIGE